MPPPPPNCIQSLLSYLEFCQYKTSGAGGSSTPGLRRRRARVATWVSELRHPLEPGSRTFLIGRGCGRVLASAPSALAARGSVRAGDEGPGLPVSARGKAGPGSRWESAPAGVHGPPRAPLAHAYWGSRQRGAVAIAGFSHQSPPGAGG